MKELAPGVERLAQFPLPIFNVYLAGDVLFDAASTWDRRRVLKQLEGRRLSILALTHVHPDHQGLADLICRERGIPLACHVDDVEFMEGTRSIQEGMNMNPLLERIQKSWAGPPRKVDRVLSDGDEVAGFKVIHAPGHAPGEVIYFRESDRVAICGDVIRNMSFLTGLPGLKEPPEMFTYDPAENRRSIRKLAELDPAVIFPGHGPAVTDRAAFSRFVEKLPA
jgi:glyoxylase-like metal-dependent hydrolase (beta-lactamase superfamily II)